MWEMSLLVWKRKFWGKWDMGRDLPAQARDYILVSYSISLSKSLLRDDHKGIWYLLPFITVSNLLINLLHMGFHPKWLPFSSGSFIKTSTTPSSTIVWINNLPVFKPNLRIISCLSFLFKGSIQTADEGSLPKGQWPAFFDQNSNHDLQKAQKSEWFFAVYQDGGAASYALFQVLMSKLNIQHRVNKAIKIKLKKWAISFDRYHQGHI